MVKRATMTRVTALATTLSLALIGMPGGTALAAPLAAELDATENAHSSNDDTREEGGFGYVFVSKVRRDNVWVWYVKVENVRKNFAGYELFNDHNSWETAPCTSSGSVPFTTDAEGDQIVTFSKTDAPNDWVHVCRECLEMTCQEGGGPVFGEGDFMKILTGELYKGRGGGRP